MSLLSSFDVVEDYVGVVRDVRIHNIYIDSYTHEVAIRKYYGFESFG